MKEDYRDKYKTWYITYGSVIILVLVIAFGSAWMRRHMMVSKEVKNTARQIAAIYNASKMFNADRDKWPGSVEILENLGYISLNKESAGNWEFELNSIESISAFAKPGNVICTGYKLIFVIKENAFVLYKNDKEKNYWKSDF